MVLFDANSRIKRFQNESQILEEYFPIRYEVYRKRKQHQLKVLRNELKLMDNKCRFIEGVNSSQIELREKGKA